ncbi:MAG TPA: fumarylacetoacetate hydrolase family protein [Methylomirabilota bacterium]|jgi:2-keto-4-pentenoate hydratase|nr:fumarylacetoacetate hydrolase family protein [Methylomirabilota bacterium]
MLDRLLETRRTHRKAPLPSPSIALDAAYRIQDELRQALVARGERVIGWKAGLTGRISQEAMGIDHPVSGFLLGEGVYATGGPVPLSRFAELAVEVELAFLLKRDLAGPGVTPAAALLAVEGALPALELVEFRWDGKPTAGDLVADGVYGNAIVLGQPLTPVVGLDLSVEGVVYEMSGQVMATNTAAEVLGNPLNSLAWLANHLGARDLELRAGDLVMSGSISALLRPKAGDVVTARFTRLGSVSARFV